MRKFLIAFCLMVGCNHLSAQTRKGQWLAGGSIGFSAQGTSETSLAQATFFSFKPDAGYFFKNNFAAGLMIDLETNNQKKLAASTSLLIAPFIRYYFLPTTQKVNVFVDASYGFGSQNYGGTTSYALSVYLSRRSSIFSFSQYCSGDDVKLLQLWSAILRRLQIIQFGLQHGFPDTPGQIVCFIFQISRFQNSLLALSTSGLW